MNSLYRKIDADFLNSLDLDVKEKLEKQISYQQNLTPYLKMCPYCDNIYFVHLDETRKDYEKNLKTCRNCGRTDPFEKIELGNKNYNIFIKLTYCDKLDITDIGYSIQLLLEQCIVNLTTGIEIYLREYYAIWNYFLHESKDTFYEDYKKTKLEMFDEKNRHKIFEKLDKRINLIFDSDVNFKLGMMFNKRNVIVHNFGLADDDFIQKVIGLHKTKNIPYNKGKRISISIDEIEDYSSVIDTITEQTKNLFNQQWGKEITKRIDFRINNDPNILQVINLYSNVSGVGSSRANVTLLKFDDDGNMDK